MRSPIGDRRAPVVLAAGGLAALLLGAWPATAPAAKGPKAITRMNVTIVNQGAAPLGTWQLAARLPSGSRLASSPGAAPDRRSGAVRLRAAAGSSPIRPGARRTIRLAIRGRAPAAWTLNGRPCAVKVAQGTSSVVCETARAATGAARPLPTAPPQAPLPALTPIADLVTAPSDRSRPSSVGVLRVASATSDTVTINWDAAADDTRLDHYRVFESNTGVTARVQGLSYTFTGLAAGAPVAATVWAVDAAGNSSPPVSVTATSTPAAPPAPAAPPVDAPGGVGATVTRTSAVLTWRAPTGGADGSEVYADGVRIAKVVAPSYTLTGLRPDTARTVTVRAVRGATRSEPSLPLSVRTAPPPLAPSAPTAAWVSTTSVGLSWAAVADPLTGIHHYEVIRGDGVQVASSATPSVTIGGLSAGTSYSFAVRAVDAEGVASSASTAVTITTLTPAPAPTPVDTTAPSAPSRAAVTTRSTSSLTLTWGASADDTGVTGYDVWRGATKVATVSGTTAIVDALQPNTAYTLTVKAVDTAGNTSAASNAVTALTTPVAPGAPTVTARTDTSVSLAWTANQVNAGVTYEIVRNGAKVATSTSTSATVAGLTQSSTYSFAVRAVDAEGNASAASAAVSATTTATPDTAAPTAPSGLAVTGRSTSSLTIAWNASTDNIGVTGYDVWRGATKVATVTGTTATVDSLQANTAYTLTVKAVDAAGNTSAPSASVAALTSPMAPWPVTVTGTTTTSVALSWTPVGVNAGVTYEILSNGAVAGTTGSTAYTVTGLAPETAYTFTVRAKDSDGGTAMNPAGVSATTDSAGPKPYAFAPFVDFLQTAPTLFDFPGARAATGTDRFYAGFVLNGNGGTCAPSWGLSTPITQSSTYRLSEIQSFRAAGGDIGISFGGQLGTELAESCTTVDALVNAYKLVIDKYGVDHIDFDLEGSNLHPATYDGWTRRAQAIQRLQAQADAAGRPLFVSITLPSQPDVGLLPDPSINLLKNLKDNGVRIDLVNLMAMDYGAWYATNPDYNDEGTNAILVADRSKAALRDAGIFPGLTDAQILKRIGVTPMIGKNDPMGNTQQTFTLDDANQFVAWEAANPIGMMSMWSGNRDRQCAAASDPLYLCTGVTQSPWDFTKALKQAASK